MTNTEGLTKIRTISGDDETYIICRADDGYFWSVPQSFIENCRFVKALNGLSGLRSKTECDCVNLTYMQIKKDRLVKSGVNPMVAAVMASANVGEAEAMALLGFEPAT